MATTDVPMLRQSKSAHQTSPTSRNLTRLQPRGALPAAGEFPAATPTLRFMPGGIDLVARERERSALRDAIVTAVGGHGGILLVAGESGVGKSTLVESVLAEAQCLVLRGATDRRTVRPYAPVVEAIRAYGRAVPDGLLGPPLSQCLALILPELGPRPPDTDQATLFEAVGNLFDQIARRKPTVMFLDDLQWVDGATAELLLHLDRVLEQAPALVLGAYRSDEVPRGHPLRSLRSELRRRRRLRELTVEPLGPVDAADLAARVLRARLGNRLAAAVYDRTQGVPFFVEEFASALAAAGRVEQAGGTVELGHGETLPLPDTVKEAVLLRVERLSSVGRHSLEIAAAAGLRFDLELVVALGGADGIDEAIEEGFLVEVDHQGAFRHDLIREAIYDDTAWTRRRAYHRRLAEELERRGAPPEAVAEHWLAGGERDRARPSLLAAAERFCQVHAYHDAAHAVRRAIEQWREGEDEDDRLAALERLGGYAQLHGDLAGALRAWQEVLEVCQRRGDLKALAPLERRLAGIYELQGAWDRALAARTAAADAFAALGMDFESATERLVAASHLQSAAKFTAALDLIASAALAVERTGSTELRARTLSLEGQIRTKLGDTERGVELAREGLALALAENLIEPAGEAYTRLASALEHSSGYPEAINAYSAATGFCHQQGLSGMAEICFACLAPAMVKTGEWDRAVEVCRAILDSGDAPAAARAVAAAELGVVYVLRGATRRARRLLSDGLGFARRNEVFGLEIEAAQGLARADALEGRVEDAVFRARNLLDRIAVREERHYAVSALRWITTFFGHQGLTADRARAAELLTRTAAALGTAEAVAGLGHALGELALADGDAAGAAQHFTDAIDVLGDLAPYVRAETELRVAIALTAEGERRLAIERLTSAYRAARRLGARPLATAAAEELARLGEQVERRLGRRAASELEHAGLSRRELEVLRLVSVGRTNREIAKVLFVSPRTIEMHVRNVLMKLGCRSRTEATHRAAELDLLESSP
jgi:predicted ATPase/DNA-binding CsgD family transcriptional regulator